MVLHIHTNVMIYERNILRKKSHLIIRVIIDTFNIHHIKRSFKLIHLISHSHQLEQKTNSQVRLSQL